VRLSSPPTTRRTRAARNSPRWPCLSVSSSTWVRP
jgi:hypothetical protein